VSRLTLRLRPRGLRAQIVSATVGLIAVVMLLLIGGTQAVLEWTTHLDIERGLTERADAALQVVRNGTGDVDNIPWRRLQPDTRLYDDAGVHRVGLIEEELSHAADDLALKALATHRVQNAEARGDYNLRAVPFRNRSHTRGVVVVSQSSEPYEHTESEALVAMIVLGLLVIGIAGVIAWRATRQALQPVEQMAKTAAEWSERDLQARFNLGTPSNELAALGETLDRLLDRVALAIRSEQRLTSELAHELRTPLTAIQGSADLALMRGVDDDLARQELEEIAGAARRMNGVISTLVDLARDPSAGRGLETTRLADVVEAAGAYLHDGLELVDRASGLTATIGAPIEVVMRAVGPLLDNARDYAERSVTIAARTVDDQVLLTISDDGEGVDPSLGADAFEPGTSTSGGTGLGLGIARRVARSLGGDVEVADADGAGATFVVSLPRG